MLGACGRQLDGGAQRSQHRHAGSRTAHLLVDRGRARSVSSRSYANLRPEPSPRAESAQPDHFHFGSKHAHPAVLRGEDRLLERQRTMFDAPERSGSAGPRLHFLETDVASATSGFSRDDRGAGRRGCASVRECSPAARLLTDVAQRGRASADLYGFTPKEVALLMAAPFLGAEELICSASPGRAADQSLSERSGPIAADADAGLGRHGEAPR